MLAARDAIYRNLDLNCSVVIILNLGNKPNKLIMHKIFCVLFFLFSSIISIGQRLIDSLPFSEPGPIKRYYDAMGEQSPLYNGREYVEYAGTIQVGHPFYNTTSNFCRLINKLVFPSYILS